jgi:hypothetical protein
MAASDEIATQAFNTRGAPSRPSSTRPRAEDLAHPGQARTLRPTSGRTMDAGIQKVLDHIQEALSTAASSPTSRQTGLKDLDERLDGGMRGGELIVVGARPSMGKSAMGLSVAVNVAQRAACGRHVLDGDAQEAGLQRARWRCAGRSTCRGSSGPSDCAITTGRRITDAVRSLSRIPLSHERPERPEHQPGAREGTRAQAPARKAGPARRRLPRPDAGHDPKSTGPTRSRKSRRA